MGFFSRGERTGIITQMAVARAGLASRLILCDDDSKIMRWLIPPVDAEGARKLSAELGLSIRVAELLVRRGMDQPPAVERFLCPSLSHLVDPFLMADMPKAVERLRRAVELKEKVLIYGDYDVDGTTGSAILRAALGALGLSAEVYIPHRVSEGYGLRASVVERAATEGARVVVSVDAGTRDHEALERARELGMDCLVVDHHTPDARPPKAYAVLNPHCGNSYPEKILSAAGVALKLAQALLGSDLSDRALRSYLKIAAIGTIADVVPLVGENRVIARLGLAELSAAGGRPGLKELLAASGLARRTITAGDVAFRIAPRLNAAGRMESAARVIDLLTTDDPGTAREIAGELERLNRERQRVEEDVLGEIEASLKPRGEMEDFTLVCSGDRWHPGVIGIVAQRLVDRYHRPALVIGVENGLGRGSGRSVRNFHLVGALDAISDLFLTYGGHAQAAGFTLPAERVEDLRTRFEDYARSVLKPEDLKRVLRVDAEIDLAEVDGALQEQLRQLEPYGAGNPAPVFVARGIRLAGPARVLKEKHLKMAVVKGRRTFEAVAWRMANRLGELSAAPQLDLAFTVEENVFRDVATLQLVVKDFRRASAASPDL